ncbi:MAG: hydroxymethylbilane synthase [Rhodospirillales bacterium 12-54-5]|nr:MAG: hydroxymethylbilane synthase [Rhodospirillales bacterium 12-54-5]
MTDVIRIGTRASKLALAQAEIVRERLIAAHPHLTISIAAMTTAGDRELHKTLADWGYKGLFTKELEDALLIGEVDIAVHSMKDMPSELPSGLTIGAVLPRADTRDAWVSAHYETMDALPKGAIVGTSSARRAAQLLHIRPDVRIVELRGNVQTRLRKLEENVASATFLAAAGLHRLNLASHIRSYIEPAIMLPAVAQGAIGVECAAARGDVLALLEALNDNETERCITAERAYLLALDGSCRTPIAGLAEMENGQITLRGEVLSLDGRIRHTAQASAAASDAERLGRALGEELRAKAGEALLQQVPR